MRTFILSPRSLLASAALVAALSACGSEGPAAPDPVEEPAFLAITIQTDGLMLDSDGYTLSVAGGAPISVAIDETVVVEVEGSRPSVVLDGQAAKCVPHGNPTSTHTAIPGDTVEVLIAITCFEDPVLYGQYGGDEVGWTIRIVDSSGGSSVELTTLPGLDNNFFSTGAAVFNAEKTAVTFQSAADADGLGEYDIFVVALNKSEVDRHRTSGPQLQPSWSPTGDAILFAGYDWGGPRELFVASTDLTSVTPITPAGDSEIGGGTWSPDASQIAYSNAGAVRIMDADGSNPMSLSDPGAGAGETVFDDVMAFSEDGSQVLYLRTDIETDLFQLRVVDADGSNDLLLTEEVGYPGWHAFGPDGRVYYTRCVGAASDCSALDVWVMDADGSNAEALTTSGGSVFSGSFSPDGSGLLTYPSNLSNGALRALGLDGTEIATLESGIIDGASWR